MARSTDKDELTTEWIAIDESDFAAQRSLFQQMLAAAVAKQDAEVEQIADRLDSMPDHSSAEARYLTSYGLTECAKLETM